MENITNTNDHDTVQPEQNLAEQSVHEPVGRKISFLVIGGIVIVCSLILGASMILPGKQSSIPSPGEDMSPEWKTFTTIDGKFSIKYPSDWTLTDQSREVDLYRDGNIQLAHEISISKDSHVFRSRNPLAWGPAVCLFEDDPPFEGPSVRFRDYVEIETTNSIFRRPVTRESTTPGANLPWVICSKAPESTGNYSTVVGFGTTWYETPVNYDPILLQELDQILSSFIMNNEYPVE